MINQIYRLVSPRQFEISYRDESLSSEQIVIRPTNLSICAADQRYYTGTRGEKVLKEKLPMALIHEGVGEVAYDPTNTFSIGDKVVIVPNNPIEKDPYIAENYLKSSQFASSGFDGFMQDYLFINKHRVIKLPNEIDLNVAAFTELVSVAVHSILRFEKKAMDRKSTFGVWGDGNLGFIMSLLLKKLYPSCKVYLFGKTNYKMAHFTFVDKTIHISNIPNDIEIDHGFECVGGQGVSQALNQIIDVIKPEGSINILGVSEYNVEVNTRMVLEKGLTIIGSSRSGVDDFIKTVEIYEKYPDLVEYLSLLVGTVKSVYSIEDIIDAFENDLCNSWGKTIMKWEI